MASFALEHLTFTYPGQTRPALSDLTLTIPEGAVTVLCGESGSGKSTLLRQLKTCLTPHGTVSGAVRLGDALLKGIPFAEQARRIGFVLQHPDDQIVTDKVFHELAFGLESLGCDEKPCACASPRWRATSALPTGSTATWPRSPAARSRYSTSRPSWSCGRTCSFRRADEPTRPHRGEHLSAHAAQAQ